jgi:small subunit ribosomal protein S2
MPIIALVDTNADPDEADYVIPGNDDAIRSCGLIAKVIANAIEQGKQKVAVKEFKPQKNGSEAEPAAPADAEAAPAEAEVVQEEPVAEIEAVAAPEAVEELESE